MLVQRQRLLKAATSRPARLVRDSPTPGSSSLGSQVAVTSGVKSCTTGKGLSRFGSGIERIATRCARPLA